MVVEFGVDPLISVRLEVERLHIFSVTYIRFRPENKTLHLCSKNCPKLGQSEKVLEAIYKTED